MTDSPCSRARSVIEAAGTAANMSVFGHASPPAQIQHREALDVPSLYIDRTDRVDLDSGVIVIAASDLGQYESAIQIEGAQHD